MGQLSEEYRQLIEEDFELADLSRTYVVMSVADGEHEETLSQIAALMAEHDVSGVLELREVEFSRYGRHEIAICKPNTPDIAMVLLPYGNLYGEFDPDVPKSFIVDLIKLFAALRSGFVLEYIARNGHAYEPDMIEQSSGDYNWVLIEVML